jgi:hypothetical protein
MTIVYQVHSIHIVQNDNSRKQPKRSTRSRQPQALGWCGGQANRQIRVGLAPQANLKSKGACELREKRKRFPPNPFREREKRAYIYKIKKYIESTES